MLRPTPSRRRAFALLAVKLAASLVVLTILPVVVLRFVPPATSSFMLLHRLDRLPGGRECEVTEYRWVSWEGISPHVAMAVIAAEDQRFPYHAGFDLESIADALEEREHGRVRGASTISQQLAKNLFLWPGRTWLRKGLEAYATGLLELLWPKRRILEVYLNVAQFGECTFGVRAASERFFGKPASALTAEEGALLAVVLPRPHRFHADRPSSAMLERCAWIYRQVDSLGGLNYLNEL